jgi:hypothetical protein
MNAIEQARERRLDGGAESRERVLHRGYERGGEDRDDTDHEADAGRGRCTRAAARTSSERELFGGARER